MTIEEFFGGGVVCDDHGNIQTRNELLYVAETLGTHRIKQSFPNREDSLKFYLEVSQFIADAINEKLSRVKNES